MGVETDVTQADSIYAGLAQAEAALGPVTIMIDSAGTQIEEPAAEVGRNPGTRAWT